ncbi:MAG: carboxypeptidase-like regulatory domain-containing protein [Bacteroidales bacterium]|nr:carboxypeptidase-like regulatory domain-containing protein [Bacteroidales bacterium]MCF8377148.1 carboxypeptidase-like regulatory domain-containing protein [Bacteroidales bacterium]MCF8401054.1 carboxypeptidase-like regulatory domain-containing protein [Bacteroidales bacterium]
MAALNLSAQEKEKELIQFSGVVVTADSLQPVPFANIIIAGTNHGTVSDYYGYFSFVAEKNESIIFSSMGFKKDTFLIPDTITGSRYSLIQVMTRDTILLAETVIYPWPTVDQFKEAFLNLDIPDDDIEIARKNLDKQELQMRAEKYPMDGSMNYTNYMQRETNKLYYAGQTQPISILNPFAWAKFIKAWREGKFKRKK